MKIKSHYKVLWRETSESEIEEFELLTVTYGTKPVSFLATKCLQQLAKYERVKSILELQR